MTSTVEYSGGLRTLCVHLRSNNQIVTDAPPDNQGKGEAFSPTDLCATSLAACMLTVMGIKARDNGWNIDGAKAEVEKVMASDPRRISEINIVMTVPNNGLDEKAKTILTRTAETCPVARSLHPDIKQGLEIKFIA